MFKEKLEKLGYKQHVDTYTKKINNWFISFVLDYYESHHELVEEIVNYYISPTEVIDRSEINNVLDILEHDIKELEKYEEYEE